MRTFVITYSCDICGTEHEVHRKRYRLGNHQRQIYLCVVDLKNFEAAYAKACRAFVNSMGWYRGTRAERTASGRQPPISGCKICSSNCEIRRIYYRDTIRRYRIDLCGTHAPLFSPRLTKARRAFAIAMGDYVGLRVTSAGHRRQVA